MKNAESLTMVASRGGAADPGLDNLNVLLHALLNSSSSSSSSLPSVPPSSVPTSPSCSIDESYKYIFLPICYSFTFLFSISLNSIVLYRSFRRTKRWNASLIYMVNLASTDFMYGLSLPFLVASYIMRDRWVFGDFMCRLVRFLFYFNLYCSIFFLTCISVHRYLGICHPMRTITLETKRAVKGTCVLVWVVVFALTCPIFRFAQTGHRLGDGNGSYGNSGASVEEYQNCWDDAIDKEFSDYVPYGIILHLLGFFVPFTVIAWCYSHVVLTIFRTLHSQPPLEAARRRDAGNGRDVRGGGGGGGGEGRGRGGAAEIIGGGGGGVKRGSPRLKGGRGEVAGRHEGMSIFLGAHSPYANRRRKSIKTIITITLLFALCFFPFHVTRTIFLVLKVTKGVPCHTMTMVSMCYKITRPLASFNAWLNALLYFLTKEKGGAHCCQATENNGPQQGGLLWPLRMMGKAVDEEEGGVDGGMNDKDNKEMARTPVYIHRALPEVKYTV